ncbi:MAG: hypothetical protein IPJ65_16180 [Archangiaceae bacterium]|nr:hypothetical protein [Archangiaceae bacterium]
MSLAPTLLTLLCVAPTLDGSPRLRLDQIGGSLSEFGGRFAIKASLTGTDEDRLGAFGFIDTRSGISRDTAQGVFAVDVSDGATPKLRTGRHLLYDGRGWTETATDGALSATVRVETLARNVFVAKVTLTGVTAPLTVTGRVDGTVTTGATWAGGLLTIDNGDRPAFGLSLGVRGAPAPVLDGASGKTYFGSTRVTLAADGAVEFLLAFDPSPAHSTAVLTEAPATAAVTDWKLHLTPPHSTEPRYLAAQDRALAVLHMGEVRDEAGNMLGIAPAKSHYQEIWLWDSSFQALGVSEYDVPGAAAQLLGVYRGRVTEGKEAGLIYNHVDETGQPVRIMVDGYTDDYSQAPALGIALREVYERGARDDAAKQALQQSLDVATPFVDWWARRRDKDGDGRYEYNGGWESGMDNAPTFTEVYGDMSITARLPADDDDPRPRINAADLHGWLYLYLIELGRAADLLGRTDGDSYRARAKELAEKTDDATEGFWDDAEGLYRDYVRGGGRRHFIKSRTLVTMFPLAAGMTRDLSRAKRVIETQLLDPNKAWGSYGIPFTMFDDPAFDSNDYWRGPVWLNISWLTMVALFRYGYEAEAEELKLKTLELGASDHGLWEYYDSKTGKGLNCYQFGWSAALYLEALRDRHQAEAFAVGLKRSGEIHRLVRLSDAVVLAEVQVEGSFEVPHVEITTTGAELFDGAPVSFAFTDPHGVVGDKAVTVSFPAWPGVEPKTAHVGDSVTVSGYQPRACGCGAAPGGWLMLAALALLKARRR